MADFEAGSTLEKSIREVWELHLALDEDDACVCALEARRGLEVDRVLLTATRLTFHSTFPFPEPPLWDDLLNTKLHQQELFPQWPEPVQSEMLEVFVGSVQSRRRL